jgi:hypothetical protein
VKLRVCFGKEIEATPRGGRSRIGDERSGGSSSQFDREYEGGTSCRHRCSLHPSQARRRRRRFTSGGPSSAKLLLDVLAGDSLHGAGPASAELRRLSSSAAVGEPGIIRGQPRQTAHSRDHRMES